MNYKNLIVELTDHIAIMKIHRPECLNALNDKLMTEFDSAIDGLTFNKEVRALIITGSGEKAFVAGGDIKEMLTHLPQLAVDN